MSDELQALLGRIGVHPNKALGQNFLTDPEVARSIAGELRVRPEDTVVEIGPGTGALSEHLVGRGAKLILIEFDQKLAAYLKQRFAGDDRVEVLHEDATRFDLRPLFAAGPVKLIGNLPYSCGGELLRRFLDPPTPVLEAVLMLQKEVAHRLAAKPRTKAYSRLTLMVGVGWQIEPVQELSPEPFYPPPTVDSSVIRLVRRKPDELPLYDWRVYDRLLRSGFSQRRKQLKRRLPMEGKTWEEACSELGFSETARAEELSLEDWVNLSRFVDSNPLKDNPQKATEMFDVVDDKDEVIGQAPRSQVHAEKLKHRAVHVFVFNKKGELFLQKRSILKDVAPGLWDSSASGHLDVGEGYRDCAVRELEEELGVQVDEVEEIAALEPCEETGWEFVRVFKAQHKGPFRWPFSEVETGAFFSPAMIDHWIARRPEDFASGFIKCWQTQRA